MKSIYRTSPPPVGTPLSPEQAMRLAVSEAYKGATRVSPNPLVGAVVVDDGGRFIASGHHEFFGGPHAEVNALRGLSSSALQNATVYVTLEPCAHEGKTPSCAKMMAQLPLKKVVFGLVDPNPLVSGQGAEILRQAGIAAELFRSNDDFLNMEIRQDLEEVCEVFLWNFRHKKIFVTLKMASSLDGQVALKSGESQWITGPESREYVHYLRACYDAILVGKGTVEFDNPSLNIRDPQTERGNRVVILDSDAELLQKFPDLKLAKVNRAEDIFWCVAEDAKAKAQGLVRGLTNPPQLLFAKTDVGGGLDLPHLLEELYKAGLRSILVEGGAMTASSFLAQGLVNRLFLFQAPIFMGSGGARSWTESLRISTMKEKIQLKNPRFLTFGPDFMITGTF